ncbi:putative ubiquitin carboxyl-terminal hydrolase 24 [Heterosigma akashiwo virus 01]|uniref:Putative ubiquitin carboxyl-terminal hydrolase 24 n=1 Tax=Heterosigma akashiwo virus 01 TaxID=97195 RepID=A0A1C9C509_HAV01|nr:putative ubiquitin carboxyl-terminal hydrolase 24 [Heterosigma akashiwo virus 01]AOM63375.1 putative ubiquitin carboxyl-terminal hydrolase 24 [Heterosigma akashiwo virus 01]
MEAPKPAPAPTEEVKKMEAPKPAPAPTEEVKKMEAPKPAPAPTEEVKKMEAPKPAPAPTEEVKKMEAPKPAPAPTEEVKKMEAPKPAPAPTEEVKKMEAPKPAPAPTEEVKKMEAPKPAPAPTEEVKKMEAPKPAPAPTEEVKKMEAPKPAPAPTEEVKKMEAPKPAPAPNTGEKRPDNIDYNSLTDSQLNKLCNKRGIKRYNMLSRESKIKKLMGEKLFTTKPKTAPIGNKDKKLKGEALFTAKPKTAPIENKEKTGENKNEQVGKSFTNMIVSDNEDKDRKMTPVEQQAEMKSSDTNTHVVETPMKNNCEDGQRNIEEKCNGLNNGKTCKARKDLTIPSGATFKYCKKHINDWEIFDIRMNYILKKKKGNKKNDRLDDETIRKLDACKIPIGKRDFEINNKENDNDECCGGITKKGSPCTMKKVSHPQGAKHKYCKKHTKNWKDFEENQQVYDINIHPLENHPLVNENDDVDINDDENIDNIEEEESVFPEDEQVDDNETDDYDDEENKDYGDYGDNLCDNDGGDMLSDSDYDSI